MKFLFAQKGLFIESNKKSPASFTKLIDFTRWFKEVAIYFGLPIVDPCCIDTSPISYSETLDANAPISLDTKITYLSTTAARAYTLANGIDLQEKIIKMKVDNGDGVVTVANLQGGTTITFNDAGDVIKLQFVDNKWLPIYNSGAVIA